MLQLEQADEVERKELSKARRNLHNAESEYYNKKGWFSCDQRCMQARDKVGMAQQDLNFKQAKWDRIMKDARKEVGIWSTFGVQDVRKSFWSAWESGKAMAAR